ncbi:hypothetical protein QVD17_22886 [Tagetes erecta]|uniref:RING-type E3 ubiquitin transferase n=1 Tax=Tagetes erecta TaxID=13708 RepID=A0AAD8NTX9_TARER|nr:hypothetical protein QVD17_22886 [Tagetes erecta]
MDRQIFPSQYEKPYFIIPPPPPPPPPLPEFQSSVAGSNSNTNVSPSVLLIIIILAIIFFISGLLHLLVRFLVKPSIRDPDEFDNVTALQGQLQQLFTLHDSGVDQSFIDTLPVFVYKSIIGVKTITTPFDCAVCLCEFEGDDNLRLLPKCSHAFHMDCIDTWLLSHSTCPLCRSNLLSDYSPNTCCSPIVFVLESGSAESSREIVNHDHSNVQRVDSQFSCDVNLDEELELDHSNEVKEEESKEKVVTIKLGKFKNVDAGEDGDEKGGKIDDRRCFSMGSFEYVMDDSTSLQVPIRAQIKKQANKKSNLPITPGHRPAMSECGDSSRRDFKGIEVFRTVGGGNSGCSVRRESLSVSKIWLRGKKEKAKSTMTTIEPPPTGTFSLQFLLHQGVSGDESKASELGCDDHETQNCNNFDQQGTSNAPSFAKRSLLWLMGRQKNKVVHSSMSTNV